MKSKKIPIRWMIALAGIVFFIPSIVLVNYCAADILIVANKSVAEKQMTKEELKKVFLGEKIKWDDTQRVIPVVLKQSEAHDYFVKTYTDKNASQFRNYWKNLVFTGKGSTPKSFDTEKEVLDYIANTEGAIGYVSTDQKTDNVHLIVITDK